MARPRVDNRTDFVVFPHVLIDRDDEKLVTMVKATFETPSPQGGELELAPRKRRRGIRMKDFPWGEPDKTPIAYPADVCIRKPATDVLFVARAHAPGGVAVPTFDAYAQVGALRKAIQIHGLRVWQSDGSGLSTARPISELEVRYDHAWGGFDDSDPKKVVEEARNPMGKGCVSNAAALTHQEAPQIEDPAEPIKNWHTRPPPRAWGRSAVTGNRDAPSQGRTTRSGRRTARRSCRPTSTIASTSARRRVSSRAHHSGRAKR